MDAIEKKLLEEVADLHGIPEGAYNIRADGKLAGRNTTAHINIVTKEDKGMSFLPSSSACSMVEASLYTRMIGSVLLLRR